MGASQRSLEDDDDAPMAEINVTPLVDVMLVLLIVFMIAAPLMTAGVPVDLPKAQAKPLNDQKAPLAVTINAAGSYFIGTEEVASDILLTSLKNQAENELDRRIHVRADKDLPYRAVLEVMGQISTAGFTKVALVSEAPKSAAPQTPQADGSAPQAAANPTPASLSGGGEAVASTPAAAVAPPVPAPAVPAVAAPAAAAAPPVPVAAAPPAAAVAARPTP
jgi:biopolymer transport protein ExbD/biopolymer transport protein TolR